MSIFTKELIIYKKNSPAKYHLPKDSITELFGINGYPIKNIHFGGRQHQSKQDYYPEILL